jgi:hypothetical protein
MHTKAGQILERIAAESLEKCVLKLARMSAGEWSVADTRVSWRSMEEAILDHSSGPRGTGAAAYFEIKGEYPFTSMVVFRPEDIEVISRGFLGFSFSKLPSLNQAQELLLSELGNVILNSLLGTLSNTLKRGFLPSAPKCVQGETRYLLEALWTATERTARHSLVTVILDLKCDGTVTRIEVIALIPDNMERALVAAQDAKPDGE